MRGLHNWTYREVTAFLKESGFHFLEHLPGSHERWAKAGENGSDDIWVEVNFIHGNKSYPIKTLKMMIWQSRIPQEKWIKWAQS
jgi:hypothetical protein